MFERARLYLSKGLDPTLVNLRFSVAKAMTSAGLKTTAKFIVLAARIAGRGNQTKLVQHHLSFLPPIETIRNNAARKGQAREVEDWEQRMAACAQQIRPDSQWRFHKDTWGLHEVIVMPRIIDSNTAIVVGPKENPDRGAVITNDGGPPNCDPPSLYHMLHGPCEPSDPMEDAKQETPR